MDEVWLPRATLHGIVVVLFSCCDRKHLTTPKWQCTLATFHNGRSHVYQWIRDQSTVWCIVL